MEKQGGEGKPRDVLPNQICPRSGQHVPREATNFNVIRIQNGPSDMISFFRKSEQNVPVILSSVDTDNHKHKQHKYLPEWTICGPLAYSASFITSLKLAETDAYSCVI